MRILINTDSQNIIINKPKTISTKCPHNIYNHNILFNKTTIKPQYNFNFSHRRNFSITRSQLGKKSKLELLYEDRAAIRLEKEILTEARNSPQELSEVKQNYDDLFKGKTNEEGLKVVEDHLNKREVETLTAINKITSTSTIDFIEEKTACELPTIYEEDE